MNEDVPFAQQVNYDTLFANLASKGESFTERQKKRIIEICDKKLRYFDGNSMGSGTGVMTKILYQFFSFIKQIFNGGVDRENIGDSLTATANHTSAKSKLYMLQKATTDISVCLNTLGQEEGTDFSRVAELITGQSLNPNISAAENMDGSIYNQLRPSINLPWGSATTLNNPGNFTV